MAPSTDAFDSFLNEPIESYLRPVLEDIAARTAAPHAEVPPTLSSVLPGHYSLGDEIDRGGMATVFAGFDKSLNRPVAIKVMRPGLLDGISAKRFENEIALTAKLEHPHIVPIYYRGHEQGALFYVMRKYDAGSLRHRIDHEGQLAIPEAIGVARNVADALDHAHALGVVHRDIKPENILLGPDGASVADFGVARFIDAAGVDRLTRVGIAVGTPEYMSPEQSDPGGHVDGRTDVYALGCVLYEMLAGEPPYRGLSHHDVIAKHRLATIPDVRIVRGTVTAGMQRALERALAKSAADRFRTAGAFVKAFSRAYEHPEEDAPARRPLTVRVLITTAAALAALVLGSFAIRQTMDLFGDIPADPRRVAVMPFAGDSSIGPRLRGTILDALRRWDGVTVADEARFLAALTDAGDVRRGKAARSVARSLSAGRFVRGELIQVGDSLRVRAGLYDTGGDTLIRDAAVRLHGPTVSDSVAALLVEELLFGSQPVSARRQCRTSRSSDAYTACLNAQRRIAEWQLAAADSALMRAVERDQDFSHAHLWLAQIRMWRGEPSARWRSNAERVETARGILDSTEAMQTAALLAFARGDMITACSTWSRLVRVTPNDAAAWYSLGRCLRSDNAVLADNRSVSGWRFRTSDHQAMLAYRRAFLLQPAILLSFQADLFSGVREMFVTSRSVLRRGASIDLPRQEFLGRATWTSGDSLVFVPFPAADVHTGRAATRLPLTDEAVRHQRRIFADVATSWLAASPASAPAMEAVGTSLEMLGDPAARDSIHRARRLATSDAERIRIGAHELFVLLKFGALSNQSFLPEARRLADSLLSERGVGVETNGHLLAAVAALTGRAALAAELSRAPFGSRRQRTVVTTAGARLLAFASLGGPSDSLRAHERRLEDAIEETLPAAERPAARAEWLARSATLAFPDLPLSDAVVTRGGDDPLLDVQLALLRGDTSAPTRYLREIDKARAGVAMADVSYDGAFPEAKMLEQLGDQRAAAARLDALIAAAPQTAPLALGDVAAAGSFMRAVALAADLAEQRGDHAKARALARIIVTFWSECDPFLRPTFLRMKSIAG